MKTSVGLLSLLLFASTSLAAAESIKAKLPIKVYRSPTCTCCGKWVTHLKDQGFVVEDITSEDMAAIKNQYKVPLALRSCHTAVVSGHVIEGHVPAEDIRSLIAMKAGPLGLSVPGMPVGTPGMEMGASKDPYQVIGFDKEGGSKVFKDHTQ